MARLARFVWLMVLSLLLAACGSALAAEQPAALPTVAASPTLASEPTAKVAATVVPTPLSGKTAPPAPTETPMPTAQPKEEPTLGYYNITPLANATLVTPFPTPVSALTLDEHLVNILLIGTDWRAAENGFRTDTLIVVSIDKQASVVTMLSIPRDLFVYVPTWGMQRINQAYADGETSSYPGGGPGLLEQTLLYNLGIPIHYYALVNFAGFRQIVDTVGGVDVPVTCQLTEYKIKDPTLDESNPDNYELYTQTVGVAHMDGALALWYARARPVGGDFFRAYRQRQVLRALYHTGLSANMLPQIPQLYADFKDVVQTDMGLWDVMQFAPLAAKLDDTQIRSLSIGPNQTTQWMTPRGEDVLLPKPEAIRALINEAFTSASANQLVRDPPHVEIVNASGNAELTWLAAETLANEGFAPVPAEADAGDYAATTLIDFTTSAKGSPLKKLQSVLHVPDAGVVAQPDPNSPTPFRVILGPDYNPCPRPDWMDSGQAATPTP